VILSRIEDIDNDVIIAIGNKKSTEWSQRSKPYTFTVAPAKALPKL
jgi:hypothetical protein